MMSDRVTRSRAMLVGVLTLWVAAVVEASAADAADEALIAAAKKEGQVTWYTTHIIDQVVRLVTEAFRTRYGVRVNYVRGDSTEIALRLTNEGKAGRVHADVFDATSAMPAIKRAGLVERWLPEAAHRLPPEGRDAEGYWVATNLFVMAPAFNTSLVPRGSEPRTWDQLLDARWKGRMAWASHGTPSGGAGFVGIVMSELGQDKGTAYLRRLASQEISPLGGSARAAVDQVIAGEFAIALQAINHQPVISARRGAPVDWIPINPSMAVMSVAGLVKGANNPSAGRLLLEFLISEEGQQIFRAAGYIPVDPKVDPIEPRLRPDGKTFRAIFFSPEAIDAAMPGWHQAYKTIFR